MTEFACALLFATAANAITAVPKSSLSAISAADTLNVLCSRVKIDFRMLRFSLIDVKSGSSR